MNTTKKEKVRYIGSFPPPFGGVTVKNDLLFNRLSEYYNVKRIKTNRRIAQFFWLIGSVFCHCPMIVGVSSTTGKTLLLTKLLFYFNRRTMKKTLYFMMGGVEANRISSSKKEILMYSSYKKIYVELEGMKTTVTNAGLTNVDIYPNCREPKYFKKKEHTGFRCVFFSQISIMKGADLILLVARRHPEILFDFYGEIEQEYKAVFDEEINKLVNVNYCGVIDSRNTNVYQILSDYDILLFPTRWKTEGVPGILVEAKIAGVPVIASNVSYNSKIVEQDVDGLIIKDDSEEELDKAIKKLYDRKDLLLHLSRGALNNSKRYMIDTYIDPIIKQIKEAYK